MDDVLQEVANAADVIPGLRCFPWPPGRINPPSFFLSLPTVAFDLTYGRGMDEFTVPAFLVVGNMRARTSVKNMTKYFRNDANSIKAAIEGYAYTACDKESVRVGEAEPIVITVGAVNYLAYELEIKLAGRGV
jgi:hypothetical protein